LAHWLISLKLTKVGSVQSKRPLGPALVLWSSMDEKLLVQRFESFVMPALQVSCLLQALAKR
jgi:hypothetical protein